MASVLLLAMSHSGRTADLLSELASTIRERATMRLRVEAERSGQRAEARFVLGFGIAVVVGVVIFGRGTTFLDAYSTRPPVSWCWRSSPRCTAAGCGGCAG